MDESTNLSNFELLLKKNTARKPSALYSTASSVNNTTIKPQDVLNSVYSQIKTMQSADGRYYRNVGKNLKVKSSFMTVNKLPVYNEIPKQTNAFETQCVSDTQLINIIEDAEAVIDTHKGMTQEFNTDFTHTDINNKDTVPVTHDIIERDNMIETQEFETTFTQTNVDDTVSFLHDRIKGDDIKLYKWDCCDGESKVAFKNVDTLKEICNRAVEDNNTSANMLNDEDSKNNKLTVITMATKSDNEDIMVDNIDTSFNVVEDNVEDNIAIDNDTESLNNVMEIKDERPLSPVFNNQTKSRKVRTPSPLVVSLESFEKFEKLAIPLIDSNNDIDTCKHLINSQILGGELCLNTAVDAIFNENGPLSPILEKSNEFQESSKELIERAKEIAAKLDLREKRSDSLKDEILFSSDEENDFIYGEFEDIPLTAALETSFYDHPNVLEETMYVGFHTASNKSIQISTDSFKKAQFILDANAKNNSTHFSLSKLVEICDEKSFNKSNVDDVQEKLNCHTKTEESKLVKEYYDRIQDPNNDVEMNEVPKAKVTSGENYDETIKKPPEEQHFMGFKTASNKNIDLSDKAIEIGKKLFMEIDDRDITNQAKPGYTDEEKTDKTIQDIDNFDDVIIQEFENIEMSLEDKEQKCDEEKKKDSFLGFKTASNKNIDVSDAAKAIIKDVFQDIELADIKVCKELDLLSENDSVKLPQLLSKEKGITDLKETFVGFKTANNKNIKVSAQALAKTKNIFEDDKDIYKTDGFGGRKDKILATDYNNQPSTSKTDSIGFKTTNKQDPKISGMAQFKLNKFFNDIDKDRDYKDIDKVEKPKIFKRFKSASSRSMKIFENLERSEQNEELNNRKDDSFKTANDKTVLVSKESLTRSKTMFEDFDINRSKRVDDKEPNLYKAKSHNPMFKGFQTASKKPVTISIQASERSKNIFKDIDENVNIESDSKIKGFQKADNEIAITNETANDENYLGVAVTKKVENVNKKLLNVVDKKANCLFKTASNKSVTVSKSALAKCKKLFDDIDDTIANVKEQEAFGFQTANNKKVEVSKEALKKTKHVFKDIEIPDIRPTFKGFQTASNKKVEISKEAIEKTKAMFNDIEIETEPTFMGFQTCRNEKVEVSKDALEKTKALFNDEEIPELNFKGFQTASNKEVEISKEAIEKIKAMFDDLETEIEPKFMGFQTCRNVKVEISKDALDKTKALFNNEEISAMNFKGFQTASKKTVHISEKALAKCKEIFKDIDKDERNINMNDKNADKVKEKSVFNFQTASNKNIKVSEDSLKKSKMLLEESVHTIHETNNKNIKKTDLGLDTNLDIINTEVLIDFETSLSEDLKTPRNKRSGSPILSCPRAKKKKFQTPYKDKNNITEEIPKPIEVATTTTKIKFNNQYKKDKKYKLNDLTNHRHNIDEYITNFNLDNILDFEFNIERNMTNTKMTVTQLKDVFLSAVSKNLIPEGWLDIHLKLILWKLLSYEVKYDYKCTAKDVIDQLKYRYDKELYNTERSALRKIFEKDDVASKTMVLCVAGILIDGVSVSSVANTNEIELLLTDGWYFIKSTIDKMLSKLVYDGKIVVGCKIVTCAAELVNCEGMSPWEDTSSVRLKIFGNSTRPARWNARLGYTTSAILSQLSTVKVDGGKINRLRVFVTRVYPMLYVEKFEDGSTVTRSERLEHLHQIKYESEQELMMERIYEEVQREFNDQESQDSELFDSGKRKNYDSGSQIAKVMKHCKDPMEFRAQLTSSQLQLLQDHTSKHHEKIYQAIQNRVQDKMVARNVVTLARGRIASVSDDGVVTKGMLSIWKPNDAVLEIFKEGAWIEIMNIVPTAIRYSEIQITAGRQSVFRAMKNKIEISRHLTALKRTCYKISDVTQNPTTTTDYNEIDTVGIVFLIEPNNKEFESNRNFQNVYLADADKNIICVNFWGGIKKFGFENILDTGQILACANLQKRAGNTRKNIPQFRVTELSYFTKTPKNAQAREMVDEMNKKLYSLDRRKFCGDCIAIKNNYAAIRCLNDSENESPYRFCKGDYSLARNKMFIDTPLGGKSNKNEDANLNLTGLDFESTFKQDTQELSPKTLMRKKKVNEKISKLKMYGEPPPLSPITIIDRSVNAKNSYKSPLVSNTPTLPKNVAIVNKLPEESPKTRDTREKSPVFSVKRTYVSVPVKLNFAKESKNDLVDHFAEEFDGSPPLSLD